MAIKTIPITLAMLEGPVTTRGYESPTAGLVVHREVYTDGTPIPRARWTVTHAPSGRRLLLMPSRDTALRAATELGAVYARWNRPLRGERFGPRGLKKRVREVADRIRGESNGV